MRLQGRLAQDTRKPREENTIHHIFFEGVVTEYQYFENLRNANLQKLKKNRTVLNCINRYADDVSISNPIKIQERITELISSNKIDNEIFFTKLQSVIDKEIFNNGKNNGLNVVNTIKRDIGNKNIREHRNDNVFISNIANIVYKTTLKRIN